MRAGDQGDVSPSLPHPAEIPHLVFSLLADTLGVTATSWWGWWRTSPFDGIIEGEQQRQIFHRCPCEQVSNTIEGFIVPNAIQLFAVIQDPSYQDITKGNLVWPPISNYSREGGSFPGQWHDLSCKKKIFWEMGHNGPISQVLSSDLSQPNASLLADHKLCLNVVSLGRWALSLALRFSKSSKNHHFLSIYWSLASQLGAAQGFSNSHHILVWCVLGWKAWLTKPHGLKKCVDRGLHQPCRSNKKPCSI